MPEVILPRLQSVLPDRLQFVYIGPFHFSFLFFLFVAAQKIAPILMVSVNRISSFCLSSSHSFWPSRLFPCRMRPGTCPSSRLALT